MPKFPALQARLRSAFALSGPDGNRAGVGHQGAVYAALRIVLVDMCPRRPSPPWSRRARGRPSTGSRRGGLGFEIVVRVPGLARFNMVQLGTSQHPCHLRWLATEHVGKEYGSFGVGWTRRLDDWHESVRRAAVVAAQHPDGTSV